MNPTNSGPAPAGFESHRGEARKHESTQAYNTESPPVLQAALAIARKRPVFPCDIRKRPLVEGGFKSATTDQATIEQWWQSHPHALIGSPTGGDHFVLDVDLPHGPESLEALEAKHSPLPATLEQRTGGGGKQFFFKMPPSADIRNSAGKLGPGLDIRGNGGYCILPPSPHKSGHLYEWVSRRPMADAPAWLIAAVTKKPNKATRTAQPTTTDTYATHALQSALTAISAASEGTRNETLNREAFGIAGLEKAGRLEGGSDALMRAAASAGLDHREASATLASAYQAAEPREGKFYHLTELGNAERFADHHGDHVRYVAAWKKWIHYDGRRWQGGADDEVRRLAQQTAKSLYHLAADAADTDAAGKLAKWADSSCRSAAITAMLREAQALLAIDVRLLDPDPFLFNCWNCTINFKTGKLQSHNRQDFITRITPVFFDPEAKSPLFENVISTAFSGNHNLIDFIQRFAGYSMTGSTKEQCVAFWHGTGANGKSTIENAIAEALGEYAQSTRPETLMVRKGENTSDLAKLKGARLVTAAEAEDGHRLAESQIKMMTGGEKLQCRFLYGEWFEFCPEFKIVLLTNHKPIIRGDDHAIWRRIRLVPFNVTIPESKRDPDLPEKLRAELPGILTWCVTGAANWLTDGLGHPEEIREATASYQTEQNVIAIFLDSCCSLKPDNMAEAGLLFQEFDRWRQAEGHRKVTQTKFGKMLVQMGFHKDRSSATGRQMYHGIGIST